MTALYSGSVFPAMPCHRGNPDWGHPMPPYPAIATEFETSAPNPRQVCELNQPEKMGRAQQEPLLHTGVAAKGMGQQNPGLRVSGKITQEAPGNSHVQDLLGFPLPAGFFIDLTSRAATTYQ